MKRKAFKIIAIVLAVAVIGIGTWFVCSFYGNPVSHFLAKKAAENYIAETYEDKDFQIDDVAYDFKMCAYYVNVSSPTSIDSHFSLNYDSYGKLLYDSYDHRVLNKENTAQRIDNEYRNAVDKAFEASDFPYEISLAYGIIEFISDEYKDNYDVPSFAITTKSLEIDKEYDIKDMGSKAGHLIVHITDRDITAEKLSEVILTVKNIMDKAGVSFYAIGCQISFMENESDFSYIEAMNFPYSDIYEENLTERVSIAVKETEEYYAKLNAEKEAEAEIILEEII